MANPKPQIKEPRQMMTGSRQSWGQKVRGRIDSTRHINTLQQIADGTIEGTQIQLNAIRMLLDRTLPTIKAIEVQVDSDTDAKTITNQRLIDVIEGQARRIENE